MNLLVMLNKEWSELIRTYRLLLVPILFAILAVMAVLMAKMMPELISSSTDLPAGAVIQIPDPTIKDALMAITPQFDQLGLLAMILLFMGTIASERASGVMTMILVKPVSKWSYVGAKILSSFVLITLSYLLSILISWYYINQLFTEQIELQPFLTGCLVYLPKLLVFAAVIVFFSSLSKSTMIAGGLSLVAMIGLSVSNTSKWVQDHLPFGLGKPALAYMQGQSPEIWQPLLSAAGLIVLLYLATCFVVGRRES